MDAVILAAGLGMRLRPHTLTTPKPLLPVQGRPILDWILAALPESVERIVVVVNYLAEQIEAYLQTQTHFADWTAVRQEKPLGTGDAMQSCRAKVRAERFLVLNGDDIQGAADLAHLTRHPAGLLVRPVMDPTGDGVVFSHADGTLERIVEKQPMKGLQQVNIGAYLFPREALDLKLPLSPRGEYEITDAVAMIAKSQPFHVVAAKFWLAIGTPEAWQAAQTADLSPARR